jgi:hypothetical protein
MGRGLTPLCPRCGLADCIGVPCRNRAPAPTSGRGPSPLVPQGGSGQARADQRVEVMVSGLTDGAVERMNERTRAWKKAIAETSVLRFLVSSVPLGADYSEAAEVMQRRLAELGYEIVKTAPARLRSPELDA